MTEIAIVSACRTPLAKLGGALKHFTHPGLGELLVREMLERGRVPLNAVDHVVFGCVGQYSDAPNVARIIAVQAGLPVSVPAFTVSRNCASGLQAIVSAIHMILAGDGEVIVAGGVEVMSSSPFVNRDLRFGKKLCDSALIDSLWEGLRDPLSGMLMGETAELLASEYKITRAEQDAFAYESHQRALRAIQASRFKDEIIPVPLSSESRAGAKEFTLFSTDEIPNPKYQLAGFAELAPVFKKDGTITAGNASPISDGAAGVLIMPRKKAEALGFEVLAVIRSWAFTGTEPEMMGLGPVTATRDALRRAGLALKDIQEIELNEAFAAQYLAVEKTLKIDRAITNVNGGAIALGHPVGATGARMVVTLVHEMRKQRVRYGLVSLCVGGGQGGALILERI